MTAELVQEKQNLTTSEKNTMVMKKLDELFGNERLKKVSSSLYLLDGKHKIAIRSAFNKQINNVSSNKYWHFNHSRAIGQVFPDSIMLFTVENGEVIYWVVTPEEIGYSQYLHIDEAFTEYEHNRNNVELIQERKDILSIEEVKKSMAKFPPMNDMTDAQMGNHLFRDWFENAGYDFKEIDVIDQDINVSNSDEPLIASYCMWHDRVKNIAFLAMTESEFHEINSNIISSIKQIVLFRNKKVQFLDKTSASWKKVFEIDFEEYTTESMLFLNLWKRNRLLNSKKVFSKNDVLQIQEEVCFRELERTLVNFYDVYDAKTKGTGKTKMQKMKAFTKKINRLITANRLHEAHNMYSGKLDGLELMEEEIESVVEEELDVFPKKEVEIVETKEEKETEDIRQARESKGTSLSDREDREPVMYFVFGKKYFFNSKVEALQTVIRKYLMLRPRECNAVRVFIDRYPNDFQQGILFSTEDFVSIEQDIHLYKLLTNERCQQILEEFIIEFELDPKDISEMMK